MFKFLTTLLVTLFFSLSAHANIDSIGNFDDVVMSGEFFDKLDAIDNGFARSNHYSNQ
jgi:hypothetical protein